MPADTPPPKKRGPEIEYRTHNPNERKTMFWKHNPKRCDELCYSDSGTGVRHECKSVHTTRILEKSQGLYPEIDMGMGNQLLCFYFSFFSLIVARIIKLE